MAIQCAAWKQCLITERKTGKRRERTGRTAAQKKTPGKKKSGTPASDEQEDVVFLTMAVTVFGVFAGTYIKIQSDMTARMNTISSLESQIADLKADNDEAYKRIRMSEILTVSEKRHSIAWNVIRKRIPDYLLYC